MSRWWAGPDGAARRSCAWWWRLHVQGLSRLGSTLPRKWLGDHETVCLFMNEFHFLIDLAGPGSFHFAKHRQITTCMSFWTPTCRLDTPNFQCSPGFLDVPSLTCGSACFLRSNQMKAKQGFRWTRLKNHRWSGGDWTRFHVYHDVL